MRLLHQMNHIYFLEVGNDQITLVFREHALVKTKMRTKSSLKILEPKTFPNKCISILFLSQKFKTFDFSRQKSNPAKKESDFINVAALRTGIKRYYNTGRGIYRVGFIEKKSP